MGGGGFQEPKFLEASVNLKIDFPEGWRGSKTKNPSL